jgi:hypothetical protein
MTSSAVGGSAQLVLATPVSPVREVPAEKLLKEGYIVTVVVSELLAEFHRDFGPLVAVDPRGDIAISKDYRRTHSQWKETTRSSKPPRGGVTVIVYEAVAAPEQADAGKRIDALVLSAAQRSGTDVPPHTQKVKQTLYRPIGVILDVSVQQNEHALTAEEFEVSLDVLPVVTELQDLRAASVVPVISGEQRSHPLLGMSKRKLPPAHPPVVRRECSLHRISQNSDDLSLAQGIADSLCRSGLSKVVRALDAQTFLIMP